MIVKDEAESLARCVSSVRDYVDEIVIVDTGSKDRTKDVARTFTDKIYDFPWNGSFADARNFSTSKARKDWVLVLDADELMMQADLESLVGMLGSTSYDAFFLIQRNYTNDSTKPGWTSLGDGDVQHFGCRGYIPNPVIRLFRNNRKIRFEGAIHEVVDESVRASQRKLLDIPIHHHWEDKDVFRKQMQYLAIAERELGKHPTGRLHAIAAAIHYNFKKDYKEALRHFQAAADKGYKKNTMLENAAECYLQLGEYSRAYALYRKLAQSGYKSMAVCSNLANLMVRRGEYEPALELLNSALAETSDPDVVEKLKGFINTTKQLIGKH